MATANGAVATSGANIVPIKYTETSLGDMGMAKDTQTSLGGTRTDIPTPGTEAIRAKGGVPDGTGITTMTTTAISQLPITALLRNS